MLAANSMVRLHSWRRLRYNNRFYRDPLARNLRHTAAFRRCGRPDLPM